MRNLGNTDSCSSFVGLVGGAQSLRLGPSCWTLGVVLHELGHALGLVHEHQRPDRSDSVDLIIESDGDGTAACNNLISVNWGIWPGQAPLTSYDFASVMHYPSLGVLSSDGCPQGVRVRINALGAQPPGLPPGSEGACTSPFFCNMIMGSRTGISQRDAWGMAQRYGYRVRTEISGGGSGSVLVNGAIESCGVDCWLASPLSILRVSAVPDVGSVAVFSGACAGLECEFFPSANSTVHVTFLSVAKGIAASQAVVAFYLAEPEILFANGFE